VVNPGLEDALFEDICVAAIAVGKINGVMNRGS
jgi:hypothetical protein